MNSPIEVWSIRVCRDDAPTEPSALVVEEEDRYLVLSPPAVVPDGAEHPIRVMSDVWTFEPRPLGLIIEKTHQRWLAVVHDLDQTPSLSPGIATDTLRRVIDQAAAAGFRRLALHPWGVRFGPWSLEESLRRLTATLRERWRPPLHKIDLRVDPSQQAAATALVDRLMVV